MNPIPAPPVGLDLYSSLFQRKERIDVGTSVSTGAGKCQPDTCSAMGLSPTFACNKKDTVVNTTVSFLLLVYTLDVT